MSGHILKFVFLIYILSLFSRARQDFSPQPLDQSVKNFGLYDHEGNFHRLYYYNDAKTVVLYIQGNSCPIVGKSIAILNDLRSKYTEKGVQFCMLNSNLQDSRSTIAQEAKEFQTEFPIFIDEDQLVAEIPDVNIAGEAFVINPDPDKTIYFSDQTFDEMMIGYMRVVFEDEDAGELSYAE